MLNSSPVRETSEIQHEKFHTDDVALLALRVVSLIGCCLHGEIQNQVTTNQRHYTDLCRATSSVTECTKEDSVVHLVNGTIYHD